MHLPPLDNTPHFDAPLLPISSHEDSLLEDVVPKPKFFSVDCDSCPSYMQRAILLSKLNGEFPISSEADGGNGKTSQDASQNVELDDGIDLTEDEIVKKIEDLRAEKRKIFMLIALHQTKLAEPKREPINRSVTPGLGEDAMESPVSPQRSSDYVTSLKRSRTPSPTTSRKTHRTDEEGVVREERADSDFTERPLGRDGIGAGASASVGVSAGGYDRSFGRDSSKVARRFMAPRPPTSVMSRPSILGRNSHHPPPPPMSRLNPRPSMYRDYNLAQQPMTRHSHPHPHPHPSGRMERDDWNNLSGSSSSSSTQLLLTAHTPVPPPPSALSIRPGGNYNYRPNPSQGQPGYHPTSWRPPSERDRDSRLDHPREPSYPVRPPYRR